MSAPSSEPVAGATRTTRRGLTVAALLLAMFMAAMETTVVATAMPTAVDELGGLPLYGWAFSAYLVAATVTQPIYGKLADLYGRKPVMLVALALFVVGSTACGLAPTMLALVAMRALQGLGAGGMQPIALTIAGDLFDLEERARMQGVFGSVWALAGLVGPLLGGLVVSVASWRWVFFLNVPFGVAAAVVLATALHEGVERKARALDLAGALVLVLAILAALVGDRGALGALAWPASALLVALFVFVEKRAREPVLPMSLLAKPFMAVSSLAGALTGAAMMVAITYLPLWAQAVRGTTPTEAGATVAPMILTWPVASAISGRLVPRVGFRPLIRAGLVVVALSVVALALSVRPGVGVGWTRLASAGFGVGMGLANSALIIAVQTRVAWDERGVATASTLFFRTIGGALGVGAMGKLVAAALGDSAAKLGLLGGHGAAVDEAALAATRGPLALALSRVFVVVAALGAAALAAGWFFPEDRTVSDDVDQGGSRSRPRGAADGDAKDHGSEA